jgi:hypothetical protein
MPKAHTEWKVLPHGPIEKLAENLWWVEGSLPGISLKRVMVIARLGDGRLVIHNAIALEEGVMKEIEAWGTPGFLVVPNGGHRLDAPAFKKRYPSVRVLAPKGSRAKVAAVIPPDGTYEDFPPDDAVRFETLHGVAQAEGAMFVRSADGTTLVLNDIMFNMDRKKDLLGYLVTTVFGSAPGPRVSRLAKLVLVKDKKALRDDFERLAAIPDLVRVIVGHEKIAKGPEAAEALRKAATYL